MNKEAFAKIPNKIMSVNTQIKNERGNNIYTNEGSYLDILKDNRIIKVVYELMVGTNFKGLYTNSLDNLISDCGYKADKDSRKSFKELLLSMHKNNIINILNEEFKPKDVLLIDTDNLYNDTLDGYTGIEQKEIDIINSIAKDNRENNTLLKGYFFIKSMCHKRDDKTEKGLRFEAKAQAIVMDEKYITTFTGITDVTKCIKILKQHELINYINFKEAPVNNPKAKIDGKNIYVVRALEDKWDIDLMNKELEFKFNQYRDERIKEGYIISNEFNNNNKSKNGKEGKKVQMMNKAKRENKEQVKEDIKCDNMGLSEYVKDEKQVKSKPNRSLYAYEEEETDNNNVDRMWLDGSLLRHLQCLAIDYNDYIENDNRINNIDAFINKFRNIENIEELDVKIKDFEHIVEVARNECYDGADDLI